MFSLHNYTIIIYFIYHFVRHLDSVGEKYITDITVMVQMQINIHICLKKYSKIIFKNV